MLSEQTKVVLSDLRRKTDMGMEVLFSDNPELKDTIKVTMGKEDAIINIKELYSFMFVIANAQQQEQLMPVKQETVRKIVKRHVVKVTKDIKKGEMLNVRCETNVPVEIWEGMRGMTGKTMFKKASVPMIWAK